MQEHGPDLLSHAVISQSSWLLNNVAIELSMLALVKLEY